MPLDEKRRLQNEGVSAVRAAARAEVRARWAAEDAEAKAMQVELPSHNSRRFTKPLWLGVLFTNADSTVKCNGQISGAEENLARGLVRVSFWGES